MRDEKTEKRQYPLPHDENTLDVDVVRIRGALKAIDKDITDGIEDRKRIEKGAKSERDRIEKKHDDFTGEVRPQLSGLRTDVDNKLPIVNTPKVLQGANITVMKEGNDYRISVSSTSAVIPPNKPTITAPLQGATEVDQCPVIRFTYAHPDNMTQGGARVQVMKLDGTLAHESGWLGPVVEYAIPRGVHDVDTEYRVVVQVMSLYGGVSEASEEVRYRTRKWFAKIYGAANFGPGDDRYIDANGNFLSLSTVAFNQHPVWGGMTDVVCDGQAMVKIPKYYVKVGIGPEGSDAAGKPCRWISDEPAEGFVVLPTYKIAGGIELDYILIGKYEACADGTDKLGSKAGESSLVSQSFASLKAKAEARGTGWHMWDFQELAAVQFLAYIELATFDVQARIAEGPTTKPLTGSTDVVYRGVHGLWRHIRQFVDGITVNMLSGGRLSLRLFGTNGSRIYESLDIDNYNALVGIKDFHTGGLYDTCFIGKGSANMATAMCPDAQNLSAAGYGEAGNIMQGGSCADGANAGLWYLSAVKTAFTGDGATGTRIAKR